MSLTGSDYGSLALTIHKPDPLVKSTYQDHGGIHLQHILRIRLAAEALVASYLVEHRDTILPENPALAASVLVITVDSVIHSSLLLPETPDMEALGEEVIAMVLRYLGVADD